ncbi:hypothetical protein [Schleiferilactobacillus perolens]|uniref:hypothetical protein n=1 Tax=Schleiferilactobacillus perolens TaxID=100468 RepID=UPI002356FCCC|nr:hypothetical protein [Schleiferilactobacillus perolens]MCI2170871.1 hypothetical protein [Schleiferilactobacillus perolens]
MINKRKPVTNMHHKRFFDHEPLFTPRSFGLGWNINIHNPIGLALSIGLAVVIIGMLIYSILNNGL